VIGKLLEDQCKDQAYQEEWDEHKAVIKHYVVGIWKTDHQ
jgi:hypothetical protein